jgi:Tol biopolymer transport system component
LKSPRRLGGIAVGAGILLAAQAALSVGSVGSPRHYLVVAVVKPHYKSMVEIVDARGRRERLVQEPQVVESSAAWSPDRSMVAWTTRAGIMVERGNGRQRRLVFSQPGGCTASCMPLTFAWSPDSRRLLVGGAGRQTNRLLTISLNGGRATDVVRPRAFTEYRIVGWAPNGRQVAYTRASGKPGTASCCGLYLIVARPDGTHPRTLFRFADPIHDDPAAANGRPAAAWSPDSRSITFTTEGRDPHDPNLAIVNVATGAVHRFRHGGWGDQRPAWSPDSRQFAVAFGGRTVTIATRGGRIHSLGTAPTGVSVTWSPRGQITIAGSEAQPWKVFASLNGTSPAKLVFRLPSKVAVVAIDRQ